MTGPWAGGVIARFDHTNGTRPGSTPFLFFSPCGRSARLTWCSPAGTYTEHFEDRGMRKPTSMVYHGPEKSLYVTDQNSIRTYDAETGEFLEVWSQKDGLSAQYLVFHDM